MQNLEDFFSPENIRTINCWSAAQLYRPIASHCHTLVFISFSLHFQVSKLKVLPRTLSYQRKNSIKLNFEISTLKIHFRNESLAWFQSKLQRTFIRWRIIVSKTKASLIYLFKFIKISAKPFLTFSTLRYLQHSKTAYENI